MKKVLFVCLGNICRSPLAQGVLEKIQADVAPTCAVSADSAATHAYHTDSSPDPRAIRAAAQRGSDISRQRARPVSDTDFEVFDRIVVMDTSNLTDLQARCPERYRFKLSLFSDFTPGSNGIPVPDPYYGGEQGFEHVLDVLEQGMPFLLQELNAQDSKL